MLIESVRRKTYYGRSTGADGGTGEEGGAVVVGDDGEETIGGLSGVGRMTPY